MLKKLRDIRSNPLQLLFRPGFWALLVNPYYHVRTALYESVRERAPFFSGSLLDIGCGSKPYAHLFTSVDKYVGMDIEISGHDHSSSDIDIFYDGKSIPFEDSSFDTVVSFETFEHVFNLDDLLIEVRRVIKSDGKLMISIPFCWPEHEQPYDFARYTSFGIVAKLNAQGFDVEYMRKSGNFVAALSQLWIEYFRAQFLPNYLPLRLVLHVFFITPMVLLSKLLSIILPKRYEYFFGLVVVARKVEYNINQTYAVPREDRSSPVVIG
jgi:SAM-dependent methyltransferase